jgi:hypothetical protein
MRSRFLPELKGLTKTKAKVKERLPLRQYFGKDEQCYIMDAKTVGNIGRYLNVSLIAEEKPEKEIITRLLC